MKNLAVDQNAVTDFKPAITPRVISDQDCFQAFLDQLKHSGLPFEDLDKDKHLLVGYYNHEKLIGTGAMEIYGDFGLLRSVSIVEAMRGKKLGSKITYHFIEQARLSNLSGLYLLTETAKDFFEKIGFEIVDRNQAPEEIKTSTEFMHVCPASAICMYLDLRRKC